MSWTIAAVQMDCRLGDVRANLNSVGSNLHEAAARGGRLVIFPECALSGYGLANRAAALAAAETLPGPATDEIAALCKQLDVVAIVGMLERDGARVFNAVALVGPQGLIAGYRKIHLPFIGVDRFVDPGDRPFAVHDLGGLRVGMAICFDASFPESARVLALAEADLIALPTNWTVHGCKMADLVCRVRAIENHVYFASVNRVGEEAGFQYIGRSSICDFNGEFITRADHDGPAILTATIDPVAAREKRVVQIPGEYEIDRIGGRRPHFYGSIASDSV